VNMSSKAELDLDGAEYTLSKAECRLSKAECDLKTAVSNGSKAVFVAQTVEQDVSMAGCSPSEDESLLAMCERGVSTDRRLFQTAGSRLGTSESGSTMALLARTTVRFGAQ
jgi:hypothetical protein